MSRIEFDRQRGNRPVILDHSIVGQSATTLTFRKDREYAACRICGDVFQPWLNTDAVTDLERLEAPEIALAASLEIIEWRTKHNRRHSESEHLSLRKRGLTFTPEAAIKLAPFGLVPVMDASDDEISDALRMAGRAPTNDVDTTLKGLV